MKGTGLNNFPQFGVMEGVKILVCGGAIAGPFGATLLGEIGAEVVHFESPKNPALWIFPESPQPAVHGCRYEDAGGP